MDVCGVQEVERAPWKRTVDARRWRRRFGLLLYYYFWRCECRGYQKKPRQGKACARHCGHTRQQVLLVDRRCALSHPLRIANRRGSTHRGIRKQSHPFANKAAIVISFRCNQMSPSDAPGQGFVGSKQTKGAKNFQVWKNKIASLASVPWPNCLSGAERK
jgi:hypothetical protein